jgi:hypothetical protein
LEYADSGLFDLAQSIGGTFEISGKPLQSLQSLLRSPRSCSPGWTGYVLRDDDFIAVLSSWPV